MGVAAVAGVAVAATLCLSGCANLGYYWQSVTGHLKIMGAAQPVEELVTEPQLAPRLRERLLLSQRIRQYASRELKLPDNPSYTRYADLHRSAAIFNVTAAPI
jgi:predicted aminopeptidase